MNKEYVSFYELSKEIAKEEEKDFYDYKKIKDKVKHDKYERQFENYRKQKQKYFENILKNQGVNPDRKYKKEGKFQIPVDEKEAIKILIKTYTSKYYKDLRNGKRPQFEIIESLLEEIKRYIEKNFRPAEAKEQLEIIYSVVEYNSKKAGKKIYDNATKMIKKSIDNIKIEEDKVDRKTALKHERELSEFADLGDFFSSETYKQWEETLKDNDIPRMRLLTDVDAKKLLCYYGKMLRDTTKRFNRIADIYSDLREEEIEEMAAVEIEFGENHDFTFKNPIDVLKDAIEIFQGELIK